MQTISLVHNSERIFTMHFGITLLGIVAGTLTTLAFLPQLLKVWRSRSAHDISMAWLVTFSSGIFLWLIYGVLIDSLPVILANLITFVLTGIILMMKLRFR
jgi:MtN3 and saliva related transmembrane protein